MDNPAEDRFCGIIWDFRLPYRLFLDDGVYWVTVDDVEWRLSFRTDPIEELPSSTMPMHFGPKTQLRLDNHGFTGFSLVRAMYPLDPPLERNAVDLLMVSPDGPRLADALRPLNRVIALYRAKTDEFWFRAIAISDVPNHTTFLVPSQSRELEWWGWGHHEETVTNGLSYLKSDRWYADLEHRLRCDKRPPFHLELRNEGRDAMARENYRLAAADFALAVEALFRALLDELFTDEDLKRPAEQMPGRLYRRYREVGDPADLPLDKKEALRRFDLVWETRDELMHAHEVAISAQRIQKVARATDELLQLWDARPGAAPLLVEGPFVGGLLTVGNDFPTRDSQALFLRALRRLDQGFVNDAEDAASYALTVDPEAFDAAMLLGGIAAKKKDYRSAAERYGRALEIDPDSEVVAQNLRRCEEILAAEEAAEEEEEGA